MSELALFLDAYDSEYPSLVREVLSQAPKSANICATLTDQDRCIFLCNNVIYIWNYKERGIPHAYKMNLPSSGLKYSTDAICLFKRRGASLPSAIAVSPEGCVRYWAEIGKPHVDKHISLNGEVAFSMCMAEEHDHVHRFLISTTTVSTFYMVEIFHNSNEQSENVVFHSIEVNAAAGIGRRMSKLLFGTFTTEKELATKTFYAPHTLRSRNVDIVAVMQKSLRFFSTRAQSLMFEINVGELVAAHIGGRGDCGGGGGIVSSSNVTLVDAVVYRRGILVLVAICDAKEGFAQVNFNLGFLEGEYSSSTAPTLSKFFPMLLPDSMTRMDLSKLFNCKLFITGSDECALVFSKSLVLIKNPLTDNDAVIRDEIEDVIVGAAVVDGLCQVFLRDGGICALRRLPRYFDLSFWKKYRTSLEQIDDDVLSDKLLKRAFIEFCGKNLSGAQRTVKELLGNPELNVAELAVELDKYFIDRQPSDIRWHSEDPSAFTKEQRKFLREQMEPQTNFQIILEHLEDKLLHHNMFVIFLQQFNLLNKLDAVIHSTQGRSGTVVLAEHGEKLILMLLLARWLANCQAPPTLIHESVKSLASEFRRRFQHPDSAFLTPYDHVFNEVSNFNELIPTVVAAGEKALKKHGHVRDAKMQIISEVGAFLNLIAKGVNQAESSQQVLKVEAGGSTWLYQNQILIQFIRYINVAFDYFVTLESEDPQVLISNIVFLAKFILGQQNTWQRENSHIIEKFVEIGRPDIAVELAEEFRDFPMLIDYCHNNMSEMECQEALEKYKKKFALYDFDICLYEYYRKKGMVNYLLAEKGTRVNDYLSKHKNINWIRNIEDGKYDEAHKTLKAMVYETEDEEKRLITLSLCKLCVLCADQEDVGELAEISESIRILSQKLDGQPGEAVIIS